MLWLTSTETHSLKKVHVTSQETNVRIQINCLEFEPFKRDRNPNAVRGIRLYPKASTRKNCSKKSFWQETFRKDFWPRNNKLSQVTVYLFLGPKWAAVLITNLKKTLDVDGTRFDNYSFSRIGIIGLWFESWLAPSINKRPGHRCETFGFWLASGEPSAFGNKVLCKGNRWLGWLPKIKTAGFWEGKNQRYFFLS